MINQKKAPEALSSPSKAHGKDYGSKGPLRTAPNPDTWSVPTLVLFASRSPREEKDKKACF